MDKKQKEILKKAAEIFAECEKGSHKLVEIYRARWDVIGEVDAVVRWCTMCGAVVVDAEFDNRTQPGRVMKMKGSAIIRGLLSLLKKK